MSHKSDSDDEEDGFGPIPFIPHDTSETTQQEHLKNETKKEEAPTSKNPVEERFSFPLTFGKSTHQTRQIRARIESNLDDESSPDDSVTLSLQSMIQPLKAPKMGRRLTEQTEDSTESSKKSSNDKPANNWEELSWRRSNDDDDDIDLPNFFIPQSDSVSLSAHTKSVTALALNHVGSRLASGGHEGEVRLWDFNGMVSNLDSFRRFSPVSSHGISALSYSPTGSHFVCTSSDAIGRIYDSDGNQQQMTVKGDMYVRDLANTRGHTHGLLDCQWHPFDKQIFLTASQDATVRIFDMYSKPYGIDQALSHLHILKAIDKRNLNIASQCHVTRARWAPSSAKYVIGGCGDGSLQLWNEKKVYSKPDKIVRTAHDSEVSGLEVFSDDYRIISCSMDSNIKLWDIRKFKEPVHVWTCLGSGVCDISVSPDQTMVATGIQGKGSASCTIYNATTFDLITSISITPENKSVNDRLFSISKLLWPGSLNQLILGCSDGTVRMLYDSQYSTKGALLFAGRSASKRPTDDDRLLTFKQPIFTMDSLPLGVRETREGGIRRVRLKPHEKVTERPQKTIVPPKPSGKEGMGGQRATHGSLSAHIMGNINISSTRDEDPVEALRAYADKADAEGVFVSSAYKLTQPKPVLDYAPQEGDDELLVQDKSKCPRCGLKLCQCGYMKLQEAIKGPAQKQRRIE